MCYVINGSNFTKTSFTEAALIFQGDAIRMTKQT